MNINQIPDFKDYEVYLVYGDGIFDLSSFLEKLELNIPKKSLIRSHVFAEDEEFMAIVLIPKKFINND